MGEGARWKGCPETSTEALGEAWVQRVDPPGRLRGHGTPLTTAIAVGLAGVNVGHGHPRTCASAPQDAGQVLHQVPWVLPAMGLTTTDREVFAAYTSLLWQCQERGPWFNDHMGPNWPF